MSTALRNWIYGATNIFSNAPDSTATQSTDAAHITVDDDGDGEETEREDNDDQPPSFPALNSAQRSSTTTDAPITASKPVPALVPPSIALNGQDSTVPQPNAKLAVRSPGASFPIPSTTGNTLMLPPSTVKPPTLSATKREKVALAPGFGPLDWANLKSSGEDLRKTGYPGLLRIPPSELKQHRKRDDCWSAFNGKVYNITDYLPYHPGGEKELLRVAGRDGTKLFMSTHAWVNADYMLDACLIGILVSEPS